MSALTPLPPDLEPKAEEFTNQWYRAYFRAICWRITNVETQVVDWLHQVKMLRKQCGEISTAQEQQAIMIGRLVSENEELTQRLTATENQLADIVARLDRQGEFLQQLRKGK